MRFITIGIVFCFSGISLAGDAHEHEMSNRIIIAQADSSLEKECTDYVVKWAGIKERRDSAFGKSALKRISEYYNKVAHYYTNKRWKDCITTAKEGISYREGVAKETKKASDRCLSSDYVFEDTLDLNIIITNKTDIEKYKKLLEKQIEYMISDDYRNCARLADEIEKIFARYTHNIEAAKQAAQKAATVIEEIAPIATLLPNADPVSGEETAKICAVCHRFDEGGGSKVGPPLWGVVNRPIASVEGFSYSEGLKAFAADGAVWDYEQLNKFLLEPRRHISGTKMPFAGLMNDEERADLVAYLRLLSANPVPLP